MDTTGLRTKVQSLSGPSSEKGMFAKLSKSPSKLFGIVLLVVILAIWWCTSGGPTNGSGSAGKNHVDSEQWSAAHNGLTSEKKIVVIAERIVTLECGGEPFVIDRSKPDGSGKYGFDWQVMSDTPCQVYGPDGDLAPIALEINQHVDMTDPSIRKVDKFAFRSLGKSTKLKYWLTDYSR